MSNGLRVLLAIGDAIGVLQSDKPNDRGEKDRRYAIVITELEKAYAYANTFICEAKPAEDKEGE